MAAGRFHIPRENVFGVDPYQSKLERSGFENVAIQSIRDDVYAPLHAFLAGNPDILERQHWLAGLLARTTLKRRASSAYAGLENVIAVAAKANGN